MDSNDIVYDEIVDKFITEQDKLRRYYITPSMRDYRCVYMWTRKTSEVVNAIYLEGKEHLVLTMIYGTKDEIIDLIDKAISIISGTGKKYRFSVMMPTASWKQVTLEEADERLYDNQGCVLRISKKKIEYLSSI